MGTITIGAVEQIQSGTPYDASGSVDTRPFVTNPGYLTPPANVTYFFRPRDAFRTDTLIRTDLALNYSHKLPGRSGHEVFAQAQLLNAFNKFQLIDVQGGNIDTSVLTRVTSGATYAIFIRTRPRLFRAPTGTTVRGSVRRWPRPRIRCSARSMSRSASGSDAGRAG